MLGVGARARLPFLFYVRPEVNRGDVASCRASRCASRRARVKGIDGLQPLYKLFLLSSWVLFRVLIYRRH